MYNRERIRRGQKGGDPMQEAGKTKYVALMEQLKEGILSGQIRPGDRLPPDFVAL